jgi:hypothetical protein
METFQKSKKNLISADTSKSEKTLKPETLFI